MKNQPTSIFLDPESRIAYDKDGLGRVEYVSKDEMFEFLRWALLLDVYYRDKVGFGMGEFRQWLDESKLWNKFKNREK